MAGWTSPRQGLGQETCDRLSAWICGFHLRGVAFPGVLCLGPGGWPGGLCPARCHHSHRLQEITQYLSLFMSKKTLLSPPHVLGAREKAYGVSVGLRLRWVTLEPAPSLLMAMKEQAHYPGWQMAGTERQWICILFCFFAAHILPNPFF